MEKETLKIKIEEIQTMREEKGKEQETLKEIKNLMAKTKDDPGTLSTLNWEASLVWQHVVMNEMAKDESDQDTKVMKEARENMAEYAKTAHKIIVDNKLNKLGVSYRFLGRVSDYGQDYKEALKNYGKALGELPDDSFSILEVRAFIAYSTVMNGDVDEGMDLARQVYDDFRNSDLGKKLKEDDYFVWAAWMSGIAPRQLFALKEVGAEYDKDEMKTWLTDSKEELLNPTGKATWGDDKFQFRVDELDKALSFVAALVLAFTFI